MQALDGAITRAEQAIAEGRGAIQDLRAEPAAQSDLAHLLTAMGQELAGSQEGDGDSPAFSVTVEGAPQTLDPILQDEIYRIAREALRNAFRHARAGQIEAEIRYEDRGLRLRIRDDGKGIDPGLLRAGGGAGHWGLTGLRERAKRIGAQVDLWSEHAGRVQSTPGGSRTGTKAATRRARFAHVVPSASTTTNVGTGDAGAPPCSTPHSE